jgi:hypothetical protein
MFKKLAQIIAIAVLLVGTVTLPALAASTHSISGTVTYNSAALKGVTVTIQGPLFTQLPTVLGTTTSLPSRPVRAARSFPA